MNNISETVLGRSILCLSLVAGGVALPAHADSIDCNVPRNSAEARGCAAASQDVANLRRYVERTKAIYAFRAADFANAVPQEQTAATEGSATLASVR